MATDKSRGVSFQSGIWRVGMLLEASYLPQLRTSPMKLINPVTTGMPIAEDNSSGVIALCKQGLLRTYNYVNEYVTPNQVGCLLHAVDPAACRFPAVLAAPLADQLIDFDEMLKQLSITYSDLYVVTGFARPSEPTILLASQHFMECYGFFTREPIWFRWHNPATLREVMLLPIGPFVHEIMSKAENIVAQLYSKSENEPVIMHQGFKFVLRTRDVISEPNQDGDPASNEIVLTFHVMDTSPVLQGRVTKDTVITILSPSQFLSQGTPLSLRRRKSTREEGIRGHAYSVASVSDHQLPSEEVTGTNGYVIQAVSVPSFMLQSQYILLPKESATKHDIFHCQNVLVEPAEINDKPPSNLSDVTVSLFTSKEYNKETSKRSHMVIAFLYEDEFELEHYIPPTALGMDYDIAALTVSYIHPELLFYLFPETLSPSRVYSIRVMRAKTALPIVKILQLEEIIVTPEERPSEAQVEEQLDQTHPLFAFFEQRSVLLHIGEVFKITTDTGYPRYYRVCSLEPNSNGAGSVDTSMTMECIVQSKKAHSYIPDIVPPSALTPEPDFFLSICPPGLQSYTHTIFSFFLPAFRAGSSTQPHRCPSVLVTGPPGVGKKTIVRAVARRCRMHVIEFNCHEFTSDITPFAEKKFTSELDHATIYDPVVIILSKVHMIGRKNISQEDPRISALFGTYMSEVNKFNHSNSFPVLVVGVTSRVEEIPGHVQSAFLHQLQISSPDHAERLSMLKSLSQPYNLCPEVDLPMLAQGTAGYVLGDLVNLFIQAFDLAVKSTFSYCNEIGSYNSEDISISGVILKQSHLDEALSTLHSLHSDSIGAPKIPNVKWEDVGGLTDAKEEILDTIQLPLQYPDLFGLGLRRSGVLLYGAPGTGKTLLAKAVATECSLNFLSVKGPELITMYVGQSEENIREVFGRARRCAPCVIFFDELDSIAPNRGRSGDSGGVMDRVVSQLLAELDGLHKARDVFIIGATNRPDLIDPALLRPGRFDRLVYLGVNEDKTAKEKILQAITRKFQLSSDVDLAAVAEQCPANLTGADLYALCSDAMMTALRRQIELLEKGKSVDENWEGELKVKQSDFMLALKSLKPSITPEELEKYKNIKSTITSS